MSDLIDRQQAINVIERMRAYIGQNMERAVGAAFIEILDDVGEDIGRLPSAQSEIVRCKNCKHWIPYDWMFSEVWQSKNIADYPEDEIGCNWCEAAMKANDFCSHAERRQDG